MQTLALRLKDFGFFGGSSGRERAMKQATGQSRPKNIHMQVLDILGERIISGQYPQGVKLPLENDFCNEFGISRPAMREVMRVLASKGLVVSKPKIGTRVRPKKEWNLLDKEVLSWIINVAPEGQFLENLFAVRFAIEPEACAIAAQCASERDLALIREAYSAMEAASRLEDILAPDLMFHQAVIAATHNELLEFIGNTLLATLASSIKLTTRYSSTRHLSLSLHKAVYTEIAARNPEGAREAARALLVDAQQVFEDTQADKAGQDESRNQS